MSSKAIKSITEPLVQCKPVKELKTAGPAHAPAPPLCSLHDLRSEDKQKVAGLLKQILDLGRENKALKESDTFRKQELVKEKEKRKELEERAELTAVENTGLKNKMAQMLKVLKSYQQRVHAMDAAFRSALEDQVMAKMEEEERRRAEEQKEEEERREREQKEVDALAEGERASLSPAPPSQQPSNSMQDLLHCPSCGKMTAPELSPVGQVKEEEVKEEEEVATAPTLVDSGTQVEPNTSSSSTCTTKEETASRGCQTMSMFDTIPVHEVADRSEEARMMTPILVAATSSAPNPPNFDPQQLPSFGLPTLYSPSTSAARARLGHVLGENLASGLLQWQVDNGLIAIESDAPPPPMVLQFDPSIGRYGAFYLEAFHHPTATEVDAALEWDSTSQVGSTAGSTAATRRAATSRLDRQVDKDEESILSMLRDLEDEGLETSMGGQSMRFASSPKVTERMVRDRYFLTSSEGLEESSDLDLHLVHFLNS